MRRPLLTATLYACLFVAATPLLVHAISYDSATVAAGATQDAAFSSEGLLPMIGTLISVLLGFLGVIFLFLTIYAGLLWMTAAGNADQVKKARGILLNAVIGLVIVLSSYAISATVIRYVGTNTY